MRVIACAIAVAACGGTRPREDLSCISAADCVVSGMIVDDCCGDRCGAAHVYNARWLAGVRPAHDRACEQRCDKQASCPAPTTKAIADCQTHRCVIVDVPLD